MTIELPELNQELDLKQRLALEVALMKKMLKNPDDNEEEMKWIEQYGQIVPEIIFHQDELGEKVRDLARNGRYDEGAEIILTELEKVSRLSEAA